MSIISKGMRKSALGSNPEICTMDQQIYVSLYPEILSAENISKMVKLVISTLKLGPINVFNLIKNEMPQDPKLGDK